MEMINVVFASVVFLTCYMIGYFTCLKNNRKYMTKDHRICDVLSELVANLIITVVGVSAFWGISTLVNML